MARSTTVRDLHVTVDSLLEGETTRTLLTTPSCPCGSGEAVSRFVTVGTSTLLGCDGCYRACHTRPEVTHHTRSSHAVCLHEATPAMRGRCRAARLRGEVFVQDGFADDDNPISYETIAAKGSKRVHHLVGDDITCGVALPKTGVRGSTDDAADITCAACLSALDDAA